MNGDPSSGYVATHTNFSFCFYSYFSNKNLTVAIIITNLYYKTEVNFMDSYMKHHLATS